jgi:orotate phosphoribosyltransferase
MNLASKVKSISELKGSFTLRSGAISDTYFDKYKFESNPELLFEICMKMKDLLPNDTEIIAGLELGGIPIVTVLSQITKIPAAFIRKEPKEYGTCNYAEGADMLNKKIVLIEDVVSSGGAIIDATKKMREDGLEVDLAICVIDRQSGGKELLEAEGIKLLSVLTKKDLE